MNSKIDSTYPPHIDYTDENLATLNFKQTNEEFNRILEYALGPDLCPKCGIVSWLSGDGGACNAQDSKKSDNPIIVKYWDLMEQFKEEEAMKLLLKNIDLIRDNFVWECHTCWTRFLTEIKWKIFECELKE